MASTLAWGILKEPEGQRVSIKRDGIVLSDEIVDRPDFSISLEHLTIDELTAKQADLQEQEKSLEANISDLCHQLARIRAERLHTNTQLESYSNIPHSQSAQSLLPAEILAEIFLRTLRPRSGSESHLSPSSLSNRNSLERDFGDLPKISKNSPLMAITQVSSSWRATALRVPEIWNRMSFHYTPSSSGSLDFDEVDPMANLLRLWLERSQPLDIQLELVPRYQLVSPRAIHYSVFDAIASHSNRIGTLIVNAPVAKVLEPILFPAEGTSIGFPSLRSLKIAVNQVSASSITPITGFLGCQSLTRLSIDLAPSQPRALHVNYNQLTELDVRGSKHPLNRSRWIQLVRFCPKLKKGRFELSCQAYLAAYDDDTPDPMHPSHMPPLHEPFDMNDLEELVIEYEGSDSLSSLLHNLRFKKLRRLELHAEPGQQFFNDRMNLGSWTKLTQLRSLRSLNMSGILCAPDNFVAFLSGLEFLEELKLDVPAVPDEALVSALQVNELPPCLPLLHRVSLWVHHFTIDSERTYMDMIKSRSNWLEAQEILAQWFFAIDLCFDKTKTYDVDFNTLKPFGMQDESSVSYQITIRHVSPYAPL